MFWRYILLLIFSSALFSKPLFIIANKNFPKDHLSIHEIRDIYLDQKRFLEGQKILPINFAFDDPLRDQFEQKVLQKDRQFLERYWIKAHYQGRRPPKVLQSHAAMLSYLLQIETALGYSEAQREELKDFKILLEVAP